MSAADKSSRAASAYRPSWVQPRANTMLTRALRKGRGPSFMRLLTVYGRTTGAIRTTPVVPVRDGDQTWVVTPFGEVWAGSARTSHRPGRVSRGDEQVTYAVRELDAAEAVPVLRRYLSTRARFFVRRYVNITAKSPDDAIAAEADRHPVFELTPVR